MASNDVTILPPSDTLQDPLQAISYLQSKPVLRISDFDVHKIIGSGSFATVKLVTLRDSSFKTPFAMKLVSKSEAIKCKHIQQLKEERKVLKGLSHPFIASFIRAFQDERSVGFLFEFVNGGELFNLVSNQGSLSESWTLFYLAEVLTAIRYLHSNKIVFRDLKAENLLITASGHLKLIDFGFAKSLDKGRARTLCGTPEYMAPEMLLNQKQGYDYAVDYWALGVLAFELATGLTH